MRVLVIYAHPVETSFNAAAHKIVVETLTRAGHEVDDCDLYAEGFNPVLSREERLAYHDISRNTAPVADYVARLRRAEGVVFVFPTWSFGPPAILKGFFDRVMMPGVSFEITPDKWTRPLLGHIRRVAAVVTYGRPWWQVRFGIGDLPRAQIMRHFRWTCSRSAKFSYLALYHMNQASDLERQAFLDRVAWTMERF